MNPIVPSEQPAEDAPVNVNNEFEGEIREFIRKDVASRRKRVEPGAESDNVSVLVQRVAGASLGEIDGVIEELRGMREYLRNEGERVQREIASYASVSQAAAASMKIITDSMAEWRRAMVAPAASPPSYRA